MKIILQIAILLLLLNACSRKAGDLEGHYYLKTSKISSEVDYTLENQETNSDLHHEIFMDFFRNGTYSMYLNRFEEGNYALVNDTIILDPKHSPSWKIGFIKDTNLGHFQFPKAEKMVTLRKLPNGLDKDYPFNPELNQWRHRSDIQLTTNELIEKFQNYLEFMQAYMRWAKNNEQSLRFNSLSGPIQFANNGLMMRKVANSMSWEDYFYEGDCEKMDRILRHYFEDLVIDWKYTHNRILMLIDALNQISKGINKHKENFTDQ
jgi:hypothetical protein